ncbi:MAG TPA: alpha/beta hydrolase [Candidatus Saccharimonadales bacterium]|nr:alpha/beta hydrolase [Candidatus Saccharimonadales bacterium]
MKFTYFNDIYKAASVNSKDGTVIKYWQIGQGPGVVLIHGGMESAQSHIELAEALASHFTVYLYSRRGHGHSGPYARTHNMQKEMEDLGAVLAKTGTHTIFGVSTGGLIALEATRALPSIEKAIIYEPGLPLSKTVPPLDWLKEYDRMMAEGTIAKAMVFAMKETEMGPPFMRAIPSRLLEAMTRWQFSVERKSAPEGYVKWDVLSHTLHNDVSLFIEMRERPDGTPEAFKNVSAQILLMGGSDSPAFQTASVDALEKVLPHVRRVIIPGVAHGGSGNSNMGGKPTLVAEEIYKFIQQG